MSIFKRMYRWGKHKMWLFFSEIWHKRLRSKNKVKEVSLICNNCVAGVIYHDLGLKFNSPTINLAIMGEDFLAFCENLDYYLGCDVEEVEGHSFHYPVGRIVAKDELHKDVLLHFIHYPSFAAGRDKWMERSKRVDKNNLIFIWEFFDEYYDEKLIHEFDRLDVKKIALLHRDGIEVQHSVRLNLKQADGSVAMSISPAGLFGKRYLDQFNYVQFINC